VGTARRRKAEKATTVDFMFVFERRRRIREAVDGVSEGWRLRHFQSCAVPFILT
jgi:hypothetical protein